MSGTKIKSKLCIMLQSLAWRGSIPPDTCVSKKILSNLYKICYSCFASVWFWSMENSKGLIWLVWGEKRKKKKTQTFYMNTQKYKMCFIFNAKL